MKRAKSKPKQLTNLASLDRTPIGRCQTSATADGNSERRTGAAAIASVPPNSRSVKAKPPAAVAHLASFFARASKNSLYYHTDGFLPGVTSFDNAEREQFGYRFVVDFCQKMRYDNKKGRATEKTIWQETNNKEDRQNEEGEI